jgi:hypothetical protein
VWATGLLTIATDAPALACEVVDQAKWVFEIASRKIRLILDNFTALLYESLPRASNVVNRNFQDRPQRRAGLYE